MTDEGDMVQARLAQRRVVDLEATDAVRPSSVTSGTAAEIEIDAYSGMKLHGTVQSFSGATGARFSLLPPENATGNFTKVVQRVPVRIRLENVPEDRPLRPGMSVEVTVDTRK